jgi:hypothetical protein
MLLAATLALADTLVPLTAAGRSPWLTTSADVRRSDAPAVSSASPTRATAPRAVAPHRRCKSSAPVSASGSSAAALRETQSPEDYCLYTCMVLDMDYAGMDGCKCVCKDVDGTLYLEAIPDC